MTTPRDLLDDHLSREPDFSFRDKKPAHFAFDHTAPDEVNFEAVAKLSPSAPQPEPVVLPDPEPSAAVTPPTAPVPVQVTPIPQAVPQIIPQVRVVNAPFSGVSLASFILALIGVVAPFFFMPAIFSLLAVMLGHIGSYRARKYSMNGAGFAAAGLTIGYVTLAVTALVAIVAVIIAVLSGNLISWLNHQHLFTH